MALPAHTATEAAIAQQLGYFPARESQALTPAALAALGVPQTATVVLTPQQLATVGQVVLIAAPDVNSLIVPFDYLARDNGVNVGNSNGAAIGKVIWDGAETSVDFPFSGSDTALTTLAYAKGDDPTWRRLLPLDSYDGSSSAYYANKVGKDLVMKITQAAAMLGPIVTSSVVTPGTGWLANDTFDWASPGGGDTATGVVDTIDGGGGIATFHLLTFGTKFEPENGNPVATGGSTGIDAVLNCDTVDLTNNPIRVTIKIPYRVDNVA